MQDRVSLHPGRVKLVPVPGQENTYDMVRADSPTQEGTPLNKDSLLKDATAALFGLGADAVPDEALQVLKTLVGNAQTSADGSAKLEVGSYVGTGTTSVVLNYTRVPKLVFVRGQNEPDNADGSYPHASFLLAAYGATQILTFFTNNQSMTASYAKLTWGENSLTMANAYSNYQTYLNLSGQTYDYVFIS